jgi:hypothetical protein
MLIEMHTARTSLANKHELARPIQSLQHVYAFSQLSHSELNYKGRKNNAQYQPVEERL